MAAPRVSIVIPNYNLGRFVGEAIGSALGQTHPELEVIVVDDGSTDDSVAEIAKHPVTLVTRPNGGVARARNQGASRARGEYLVFLDADDVLEPTYVARCLEAIEKSPPRVAYVYTDMAVFGTEQAYFKSGPFNARSLLRGNLVHASALLRRSAFERAGGFSPDFRSGHEDHELWVRLLTLGHEGVYLPAPLLRYRRRGGSRNVLTDAQLDRLQMKLMLTYPKLYWRTLLLHPYRTLRGALVEHLDPA